MGRGPRRCVAHWTLDRAAYTPLPETHDNGDGTDLDVADNHMDESARCVHVIGDGVSLASVRCLRHWGARKKQSTNSGWRITSKMRHKGIGRDKGDTVNDISQDVGDVSMRQQSGAVQRYQVCSEVLQKHCHWDETVRTIHNASSSAEEEKNVGMVNSGSSEGIREMSVVHFTG